MSELCNNIKVKKNKETEYKSFINCNIGIIMDELKTCFIVMPITTPEMYFETYNNDKEHFRHVLQCLHIPAIKAAGLKPIPPLSEGSEVIQSEIIRNLETADIVLCDMSILNPNVFFEYGIRTSLNKTVCVISDNKTEKIPFDISIINRHIYDSKLDAWQLEIEKEKLKTHICNSIEKSNNENALWKHFGLRTTAKPSESQNPLEEKVDFIMNQVENIAYNKISNENSVILENGFMTIDGYELEQLYQLFSSIEEKFGFYPNISQINSNGIIISINGLLTNDAKLTLKREILKIFFDTVFVEFRKNKRNEVDLLIKWHLLPI